MTILWDESPRLSPGARIFALDARMWATVVARIRCGWNNTLWRVRLDDGRLLLLGRAEFQTAEDHAVKYSDVQPVPGAPAHIYGVVIGGRS